MTKDSIHFRGQNFVFPIKVYFKFQTLPIKMFLWGLLLMSGYATLKFFFENKMEGVFLFGFIFIFMIMLVFAIKKPALTLYPNKIISHQIGKDKELYWKDCDITVNLIKNHKNIEYHWLYFFDRKNRKNSEPLFIINVEKICFEKHDFGINENILFFTKIKDNKKNNTTF